MSGAAREATQDVGGQCRELEAKNVFPSHLRTRVPRALNVSPRLFIKHLSPRLDSYTTY